MHVLDKLPDFGESTSKTTLVTGLWDLGRSNLGEEWQRPFASYLSSFLRLLQTPSPMIIYAEESLRYFVEEHRVGRPTLFVSRSLNTFEGWAFDQIQRIRHQPEWLAQARWLAESPQAKLPYYNPVVMAKPLLLNDAAVLDPFGSTHLFWIDAAICRTVESDALAGTYLSKGLGQTEAISFAAFPYPAETEIHGFAYDELCGFAGSSVSHVCRGGLFGGPKKKIPKFSADYQALLKATLAEGLMGTEESLFSILAFRDPEVYDIFELNGDGLLQPYFDALCEASEATPKIGLYILTFNSPQQLRQLFTSFERYDPEFLMEPELIVIDNSTDDSTTADYLVLQQQFGFRYLKQENSGACGGRRDAAIDAHEQGYDSYFYFEDDMRLASENEMSCTNGFNRQVKHLYRTCLRIANQEGLDFLKLSFSEFYGANHQQWAWFNVPNSVRERCWPNSPNRPVWGNSGAGAPNTNFSSVNITNGIPYALGEVYYSNWPQLVSRKGNEKMFLSAREELPSEQTWMSQFYQATNDGRLKMGVLLASPIVHERFEHYPAHLRKEG